MTRLAARLTVRSAAGWPLTAGEAPDFLVRIRERTGRRFAIRCLGRTLTALMTRGDASITSYSAVASSSTRRGYGD
jgi:hypothetical protein